MNRRALLKAAPAAALVGALPAAAAQSDTPVMALFRAWQVHNNWLNSPATRGMPDEQFDALCQRDIEMMEAMCSAPARDLQDLCLKLIATTEFASFSAYIDVAGHDQMKQEARALIGA